MIDLGWPDVAVINSAALGCSVLAVKGEGVPIPAEYASHAVYTWDELAALVDGGLVCTHPRGEDCQHRADLRQIHTLKLRFGGTVAPSGAPASQPAPIVASVASDACPTCGGRLVTGRCGWCA